MRAEEYESWRSLPDRAERQGMAPLLYNNLKSAATPIPNDCLKLLAGLTLRHRHANSLRTIMLADYLRALHGEGIEALVLKGAALANSVYPKPGLRPMRDMDILVHRSDAIQAQQTLLDLGFEGEVPQPEDLPSFHHLPIAQRVMEGMTISIELHHWLLPTFSQGRSRAITLEMLSPNARPLQINDTHFLTLGYEDMLWHIYRHSFAYPLIEQPVRLIWVADFVSLVEKFVDEIDWERVKSRYPQVWQVIPVFHYLTPWSEKVINQLKIEVDPQPKGIGKTFEGWPHSSLANQRQKGIGRFLTDTFWPSEWWAWLYYGVSRRSAKWWWIRMVRHPLHIGGWVLQYLRKRI